MANLFDGVINTDYEYQDIETAGDFSFVSGTTYTIQVKSGVGTFSKDEAGGITIGGGNEFTYTPDDGTLYIKTNGACSLSIL